jgi:threonine aldolase
MMMKYTDLRSDTITKPTPGMLDAMMAAEVGDDVFGGDPTMGLLQERLEKLFGMDKALFFPSGTMANQVALRIQTSPQDEVICHKYSHIYMYEGGGMAANSQLSPKLLEGDRGRITAEMVAANINPDDIHYPKTALVGIENTMNKGGGSIYNLDEIKKIRNVCDENDLNLHMDGARLFNALVEKGESPNEYGKLFNTISVCFSKGLGAPIGSVLLMREELYPKALRVRKMMGGGMRQVGYLAAACLYALDHHVDRLKEDHQRARVIGEALSNASFVQKVLPVDTNIVIVELEGISPEEYLQLLEGKGVLAVGFGSNAVRFVTHLDFGDGDLERVIGAIKGI